MSGAYLSAAVRMRPSSSAVSAVTVCASFVFRPRGKRPSRWAGFAGILPSSTAALSMALTGMTRLARVARES